MKRCPNCGAKVVVVNYACPRCGIPLESPDTIQIEAGGSLKLGFFLGLFFSGLLILILVRIFRGKYDTRRGAFWIMIIQFVVGYLTLLTYLSVMQLS